jgi:xanthine/CO dehydrogenase XdhC/CoxF family maturation factor
MKDDGLILAAWKDAQRASASAILATVVKVTGSSYRGPGARMLITGDGGRTGSISGGCLEGDVVKKAWWLTGESDAVVRVYDNTSDDEAVWAFGLGCNGVVHVLLERLAPGSNPLTIELVEACRNLDSGGVLATVISPGETGQKFAIFPDGSERCEIVRSSLAHPTAALAREVFESRESQSAMLDGAELFIEFIAPPLRLLVVGAGQDALPLTRFARELGWHVTVLDGRSHLARPERFPQADQVLTVDLNDPLASLNVNPQTAAVIMSHSYEQDMAFLGALHPLPLRYLGALGPRKRTERMLAELGYAPRPDLHSPVGLDLGADTSEEIALAIVSEIQATVTGRPGGMLLHKPGPIHARPEPVRA